MSERLTVQGGMRYRETIDELLNAPEGEHYQFKEWKNKDDLKEAVKICCALSNCGGGKLVLGVTDRRPRRVVGSAAFPQPERVCVDITGKLRIRVDFQIYEHKNGRVLVFEAAGRPIGMPVQTDGGAWWYHGSLLRAVTRDYPECEQKTLFKGDSLVQMPEDIRRAIYAESGHDFSGDICPDAVITDLDGGAIEAFRKTWTEYSGNKRIVNLSAEQLLRDCNALTDDGITYAALILFGKHAALIKYLPQSEIVFEYRSSEASGPAAQREEFCEGFFKSFSRVWELINLRNDKQHYQDGLFVFPVSTFNERVVREALLNAVSHRDYQLAGSIFVRQYRDRLVIESPGGFPIGVTVENITDRQSPRNNLIAKIFQLCGLVERSGQGMNLIYELTVKEAKPLPDFNGSDAYFVNLTLNGQIFNSRMLTLFKKIGDERLESMTTDEYVLISMLFSGKGIDGIQQSRFEHLIELGIVNRTKHGLEVMNSDLALVQENDTSSNRQAIAKRSPSDCQAAAKRLPSGRQAAAKRLPSDRQAAETNDRKQQIIAFIAMSGSATSSQLAKFTGLTQGRVRAILQELVSDDVIVKINDNRYAGYALKNNDE
jgi:ATP-dependent DNA helicase RecG